MFYLNSCLSLEREKRAIYIGSHVQGQLGNLGRKTQGWLRGQERVDWARPAIAGVEPAKAGVRL
jgi:hypothetical protein